VTTLRPLLAYLPWNARDAVVRACVPPLIFLLVVSGPLYAFGQANAHLTFDDQASGTAFALSIYTAFVQLAMTLGAIAMMNQIVSLDRERQFFRFLFPHQVAPWMFYLQRFTVSLVLFLSLFATIPLGYSFFITDVPVVPTMQAAAMYGLLFGSLAMLSGALVQRDGIALIGVFLVGTLLQSTASLPKALTLLGDALPPFDTAGAARSAWLAGRAVEAADVVLVVGYSLAMLIASLAVIKRLPLVR
jgi:hypothetical protein